MTRRHAGRASLTQHNASQAGLLVAGTALGNVHVWDARVPDNLVRLLSATLLVAARTHTLTHEGLLYRPLR